MTEIKKAAAHHFRYVHQRDASLRRRITYAFEAGARWGLERSAQVADTDTGLWPLPNGGPCHGPGVVERVAKNIRTIAARAKESDQ